MGKADAELGGVKAKKAAPLLFSCRLTFFILCLFASFNFILLKVNINFALVCMVKAPSAHVNIIQPQSLDFGGLDDTATQSYDLDVNLNPADDTSFDSTTRRHTDSKIETEQTLDNLDSAVNAYTCQLPTSNTSANDTGGLGVEGEFEWDKSVQANVLGSFFYGYIFTNIIGGWGSDKFGGRGAFIGSAAILSVLTLLNPIAALQGSEYLFVVRFLQGMSQGATVPLVNVLSARWSGNTERAFLMAIGYGGFSVGSFVTNPLCAFICKTFGWSYIFYVTGGFGLLWCLVSYFLMYDWPEEHPRISKEELEFLQKTRSVQPGAHNTKKLIVPWKHIFLSLPINVIHFSHFCTLWGYMMLAMYIPQYFKEVLHMDISRNGILSSIPFLGMLILHCVTGSIFDSCRKKDFCSLTTLRKGFNTLGMGLFTLSLALLSFIPCTDNTMEIILVFLVASFWEFAMLGGYFFSVFEVAPRFNGIITGISTTFGVLPGFLCPALVSYLTQNGTRQEWLLVFYITSALSGAGTLVYLLFGSSELQPWAETKSPVKEAEMEILQKKLISSSDDKGIKESLHLSLR